MYYRVMRAKKVTQKWIQDRMKIEGTDDQKYLQMNPYAVIRPRSSVPGKFKAQGMWHIHFDRRQGAEEGNKMNEQRKFLMSKSGIHWKNDGLNTLKYDVIRKSDEILYEKITVDFPFDNIEDLISLNQTLQGDGRILQHPCLVDLKTLEECYYKRQK